VIEDEPQPEGEWPSVWGGIAQRARLAGFFLIHLEPGEMAVAYVPATQSEHSRIVAIRRVDKEPSQ